MPFQNAVRNVRRFFLCKSLVLFPLTLGQYIIICFQSWMSYILKDNWLHVQIKYRFMFEMLNIDLGLMIIRVKRGPNFIINVLELGQQTDIVFTVCIVSCISPDYVQFIWRVLQSQVWKNIDKQSVSHRESDRVRNVPLVVSRFILWPI